MTDAPEFFSADGVRDDDASWDALAERISARALRDANRGGFERFAASRTALIAAALLLAAALASFATSASPAPPGESDWARALAPADDVGRVIATTDGPPALASLVFTSRDEGRTP